MSRGEATRSLNQREIDREYREAGIIVNVNGHVPIDEAAPCYKPAEDVIEARDLLREKTRLESESEQRKAVLGRYERGLATDFEGADRATRVAANVGQGIALLFGILGVFGNPMLVLIALFVFLGAGQESAFVQMRSVFDGVPVSRAMIRDFQALRADEPISKAVELLLNNERRIGDERLGFLAAKVFVVVRALRAGQVRRARLLDEILAGGGV